MRNRLKVLRAERGLVTGRPGRRLNVSRQTVNAIETGKYDASLDLAFLIARLSNKKLRIFSSRRCSRRNEGGEYVKRDVEAGKNQF